MAKFKVEITEILQRQLEVEAPSKEDALRQIEQMYKEQEIILDSSDYKDCSIKLLNKEREKIHEQTIWFIR